MTEVMTLLKEKLTPYLAHLILSNEGPTITNVYQGSFLILSVEEELDVEEGLVYYSVNTEVRFRYLDNGVKASSSFVDVFTTKEDTVKYAIEKLEGLLLRQVK